MGLVSPYHVVAAREHDPTGQPDQADAGQLRSRHARGEAWSVVDVDGHVKPLYGVQKEGADFYKSTCESAIHFWHTTRRRCCGEPGALGMREPGKQGEYPA
jgi:hypothetical protein